MMNPHALAVRLPSDERKKNVNGSREEQEEAGGTMKKGAAPQLLPLPGLGNSLCFALLVPVPRTTTISNCEFAAIFGRIFLVSVSWCPLPCLQVALPRSFFPPLNSVC